MHVDTLREQLRATPFKVFNIVLATGERIEVRHPEMVAVGHRTAVVVEPDDRTHYVDVALVVKLEREPVASAAEVRPEEEEG